MVIGLKEYCMKTKCIAPICPSDTGLDNSFGVVYSVEAYVMPQQTVIFYKNKK